MSVDCNACENHNTIAKVNFRNFLGEVIGTFLMCFFGIGAVAGATLFSAFTGPFQVGMVWGVTIAIAIYVTRNLSDAHFNPAVTVAMVVTGRMPAKKLVPYILGQCVGAFLAALVLWILFANSVELNLTNAGIDMTVAGSASSIWCEVFPNTALGVIPTWVGALAEGFGVFLLVFIIFSLTDSSNVGRPNTNLAPLFIGFTVTMIICTVGPMTDAGLNPARDFMPRVMALIAGWSPSVCFSLDAIVVYVVAPLIGGIVAGLFFTKVVQHHQHCGKCLAETDAE
jgi:glycerol uptake facilitator protein